MPDVVTPPDHTMPLLTRITQESLDEDYQHVADRRAADPSSQTRRPRHWVAGAMVAAFGILVTVAAVQTSQRSGVDDANRESLVRQIMAQREDLGAQQTRLVRLRELNIVLQDSLDETTAQEQVAINRIERIGSQTGFAPVFGPGLVITVDDAPSGEAVRDEDLALLVNGLWAAGAEAISINGKRLTARSALRNSGAAINLNGPPPMSPPYVVSVIGDNQTLEADLLETTTGLQFRGLADALGFLVTTQTVSSVDLPAGPTRQLRLRYAVAGSSSDKPVKPQKETP